MPGRPFESIIKELCEEVLSEPDPQALPDKIIQHVQKVFPSEWSTLWVTEQKESTGPKRLRLAAAAPKARPLMTADGGQPAVYDFDVDPPEGLTGYIATQTEPICINGWEDFSRYPHAQKYDAVMYRERSPEVACRSVLGVPLLLKSTENDADVGQGRVIGVLKLENIQQTLDHPADHFTDTDVAFAAAYGAVIAVALEKAQMRADSIKIGSGLLEISKSLLDRLGERPDLRTVVEKTASVISAEACALWLREGLNLYLKEEWGYPGHGARRSYPLTDADDCPEPFPRVGLTGYVARTLEPLNLKTADEVRNHPAWRGANDGTMWGKAQGTACYSLVAIPLVDGETEDLKGVFKIENKRPTIFQLYSHFSNEDQRLLQTLGNSICLSLIIAERFDRLQRLESLVGQIRVFDKPEAALYFVLTGLTHGSGLQYNRALAFQLQRSDNNKRYLSCVFAVGHVDAREWDLDMRTSGPPGRLDFTQRPALSGRPYSRTPIWRAWYGKSVALDAVRDQLLARHASADLPTKKYDSNEDLTPQDILSGFASGHFVITPIYVEGGLWGLIFADNRFTGNRINQFESQVLDLFGGMAGAVLRAASTPQLLTSSLRQSSMMMRHRIGKNIESTSIALSRLRDRDLPLDIAATVNRAFDRCVRAQRTVGDFDDFANSRNFSRPDFLTPQQLVTRLETDLEDEGHEAMIQFSAEICDFELPVNIDRIRDDFVAMVRDSKRHKALGGSPSPLRIEIHARQATSSEAEQFALSGHGLRITYKDNGPGIPADLREAVFRPFFTTMAAGSGLGLAIAKDTARGHEGTMREIGKLNDGVEFEIYYSGGRSLGNEQPT
jgi:GAF domain-containing protein